MRNDEKTGMKVHRYLKRKVNKTFKTVKASENEYYAFHVQFKP